MSDTKDYILPFSEIEHLLLCEAKERISSLPGRKLKDITLADLLLPVEQSSISSRGIYVFKHNGGWFYIGKNSSRSFLERIGSHLDTLPENSFQRLLRYFIQEYDRTKPIGTDISKEEYQTILPQVLDEINMVIIPFSFCTKERGELKLLMEKVERNLRFANTGARNQCKGRKHYLHQSVFHNHYGEEIVERERRKTEKLNRKKQLTY